MEKGNPGKQRGKYAHFEWKFNMKKQEAQKCIERGQKPGVFVIVGCKKELF